MSTLLPPNASPLERALDESAATRLAAVPVDVVGLLYDPQRIPAQLLPWLAWAWSVDEWSPDWTEAQQRAAVAASFTVHQLKGTRGAVRRAVEAIYASARITEWFENGSEPGTFDVDVEVTDEPVTEQTIADLIRVVTASKNVRSHFDLRVIATVRGTVRTAAGTSGGDIVTVLPWYQREITSTGSVRHAAALTSYDTVEVFP